MRILKKPKEEPENTIWYVLLFVAILFFTLGLTTGNVIYNFIAIGIAIVIYKFGYEALFGEYNRKQKAKKEKSRKLYEKMQENYENKKEK